MKGKVDDMEEEMKYLSEAMENISGLATTLQANLQPR